MNFVMMESMKDPDLPRSIRTGTAAETQALAARLAARLRPGDVVALVGDLGAGKTCFAQGLGRALGVTGPMGSPTFTLINEYDGRMPFHHVDLYRLSGSAEALDLGLDELLDGDGVTAIEWPERAPETIPPRAWTVRLRLDPDDPGGRWIEISPGVSA